MSSLIICPTCGLNNGMSSAFCRSCGTPVKPDPNMPAPAGAPGSPTDPNAPAKCASCGTLNDARNIRCLRCGNDLR